MSKWSEDYKKYEQEKIDEMLEGYYTKEERFIDFFVDNMDPELQKRWLIIDDMSTNFKNFVKINNNEIEESYDLLLINRKEKYVVIVEILLVYNNEDSINYFFNNKLPRFKILFPLYKDYNLYWWVWSLIVWEHQEKLAEKKWLFVFTQWKDWNAMIMNKKDFKAKIF